MLLKSLLKHFKMKDIFKRLFNIDAKAVTEPLKVVGNILDEIFTSKDEKLTHEEIKLRLMMKPDVAQIEMNKMEAQNRHLFVAGWRPFIGWICGVALLYNFILRDLLAWTLSMYRPLISPPPELAMEYLITILTGMLGFGGLRTFEKLKGKAK